jgi:hypothetical protein
LALTKKKKKVMENTLNFILEVRRRSVKGFEVPPTDEDEDEDDDNNNDSSSSSSPSFPQSLVNAFRPRTIAKYLSGTSSEGSSPVVTSKRTSRTSSRTSSTGNRVNSGGGGGRGVMNGILHSDFNEDNAAADGGGDGGENNNAMNDDGDEMKERNGNDQSNSNQPVDIFNGLYGNHYVWASKTNKGRQQQESSAAAEGGEEEELNTDYDDDVQVLQLKDDSFLVRIFNDDIHTYDEVTGCLCAEPFAQTPLTAPKITVMVREG